MGFDTELAYGYYLVFRREAIEPGSFQLGHFPVQAYLYRIS